MLYRGVNKKKDEQNNGQILPAGDIPEVIARHDGKWRLDGTFKAGPCQSNTARAQQIDSGLYDACAISTSKSENEAIRFATTEYLEEGYVYVIDETRLQDNGFTKFDFPNPLVPDEQEVTIIGQSKTPLPETLIIEKYAVDCDGNKI